MEIENDNIIVDDPILRKQEFEKESEEECVEEWMKCWETKKFPHGSEYNEYSDWRKFRDFWFRVYPELPLKVAHTIYLLKLKEEKTI